jgi:hypothetical protein
MFCVPKWLVNRRVYKRRGVCRQKHELNTFTEFEIEFDHSMKIIQFKFRTCVVPRGGAARRGETPNGEGRRKWREKRREIMDFSK